MAQQCRNERQSHSYRSSHWGRRRMLASPWVGSHTPSCRQTCAGTAAAIGSSRSTRDKKSTACSGGPFSRERDGDQRRAAPSEEKISEEGEKRASGPQRGFTQWEEEARLQRERRALMFIVHTETRRPLLSLSQRLQGSLWKSCTTGSASL